VELMLLGMGIVYGFLAMLVFLTNVMSVLVRRFFPDMPSQHPAGQALDEAGVVAAISAALHQYRKKYPKL
ncbi:MAG: OadG family protein, partial [Methylomonas sp.]